MTMQDQSYQGTKFEPNESSNNLGLPQEVFDRLLTSANKAHSIITELGPFYGQEEITEPTFRITAEPVKLPIALKETLTVFGNDLLQLGKVLEIAPDSIKKQLGTDVLEFFVPPTWRIDAILDENGELKVTEIEGRDRANALMMAEQFAYGLQTLPQSTAAYFLESIKQTIKNHPSNRVAFLREDPIVNRHTANDTRFIGYLQKIAKESVIFEVIDESTILEQKNKLDWNRFSGIINETSLPPRELYTFGIRKEQLITAGNYGALTNKAVFALVFAPDLAEFWTKHLGSDRLNRLQQMLIPSHFIQTEEDLENTHRQGRTVKVAWAGLENTHLINRANGVALPEGEVKHSSEERWSMVKELLKQNVTIIAQDFVRPAKIPAYLRKKGTSLEAVSWYNRICVKYVVDGNPYGDPVPQVAMTAVEATLGPDIIPAGRKCAFTAGTFA